MRQRVILFRALCAALLAFTATGCGLRGAGAGGPALCAPAPPEGDVVPVETKGPAPKAAPAAPVEECKAAEGKPYLDFTAPKVGGGELRLSDYVGRKVVVLQFWGVRCAPCLAEMAFLSDLQRKHPEGLQVIGVNTDRAAEPQLRQAMASRNIAASFPLVADPTFYASGHYTQWLVPVSVLIDRKGVIRAVHTGYNAALGASLQGEIEDLLREAR